MDKIEKGISAAGNWLSNAWKQATTKVTAERLNKLLKDANIIDPATLTADSDAIAAILKRAGVPSEFIESLYSQMGIPAPQGLQAQPNAKQSDNDIVAAYNAYQDGTGPELTMAQKVRLDAIRKRQGMPPINVPTAEPGAAGGGTTSGSSTAPGTAPGTSPGTASGDAGGGSSAGDGRLSQATDMILPQIARMVGTAYADDLITIIDTAMSVLQRSAPMAYREKLMQLRGQATGKQRDKATDIIKRTKKRKSGVPTDTAPASAPLGPSRVIDGGDDTPPPWLTGTTGESRRVYGGKYIKESIDVKLARQFENKLLSLE